MRNKVFDNTSSKLFFTKSCPLSGKEAPIVDYKNINLLRRYMTEKGKILPSRVPVYLDEKYFIGSSPLQVCIWIQFFKENVIDEDDTFPIW